MSDKEFEDWKRQNEERLSNYGKDCIKQLEEQGLPGLTEAQAIQILEPSDAPENFICDGEISHAQAMRSWKQRLTNLGLTPLQITKAKKVIFG